MHLLTLLGQPEHEIYGPFKWQGIPDSKAEGECDLTYFCHIPGRRSHDRELAAAASATSASTSSPPSSLELETNGS